jgi:autoinducer 2-degrading protein
MAYRNSQGLVLISAFKLGTGFQAAAPLKERKCMLVVHVQVHVKPESVETFKAATLANARESIKEPGIARFDIVQQQDDPTRFVFVEVYRTAQAPAAHKETKHYQTWRDAVAPLMAEPRSSVKFINLFPDDQGW